MRTRKQNAKRPGNKMLLICSALATILLLAAAGSSAWAQDADPPSRVARLDYLQGTVSFQPSGGGDNDWVAAELNRPVTTGDRVWTDQDGRAELHIGSTAIHLDHNSGISFLSLSDNSVQVQLSAGSMSVRVRHMDASDSFEVDAPNLAFSLLQPGTYRVDVDPDKNVTVAAVFQGLGEVTGGGRSYQITADQRATFTGTDSLDYNLADADAGPPTEFDNWAMHRDRNEDRLNSTNYVSPEMTGVSDLDAYGSWQTVPDYGPVWFPGGVAVGWAPYRLGHWAWIQPWGWTWVADEPWGFAPYHYGRWSFVGGAWGWVPGPLAGRPVYAPALVAWVGGTPGFSSSVAIGPGGGVGWFPLGPREVFVPSYRVSDTYVTRINVTNTVVDRVTVVNVYHNTDARNVTYVNQHVGGGVTVVSHDSFVNARPVSRNLVNVPESELSAAPISRGISEAPVRASLVGEGRPVVARPPTAILNRTVVTKRVPSRAPVRFEEQVVPPRQPSQPSPSFRPPAQPSGPAGNQQGRNGAALNSQSLRLSNVPSSNPYVRPAPAVHPPTPVEQKNDAGKEKAWQRQHEEVHHGKPPKDNR